MSWIQVLKEVANDTEPKLGGNLDVNEKNITSSDNKNIKIEPDGTGKIILHGLSWPTTDGGNGHILQTDGSGNLSWAPLPLEKWDVTYNWGTQAGILTRDSSGDYFIIQNNSGNWDAAYNTI